MASGDLDYAEQAEWKFFMLVFQLFYHVLKPVLI